jgi:hypothetical protein
LPFVFRFVHPAVACNRLWRVAGRGGWPAAAIVGPRRMSAGVRTRPAAGYWPWPVKCRAGGWPRQAAVRGRHLAVAGLGPRHAPVRGRLLSVAGPRPWQASVRGRLLSPPSENKRLLISNWWRFWGYITLVATVSPVPIIRYYAK